MMKTHGLFHKWNTPLLLSGFAALNHRRGRPTVHAAHVPHIAAYEKLMNEALGKKHVPNETGVYRFLVFHQSSPLMEYLVRVHHARKVKTGWMINLRSSLPGSAERAASVLAPYLGEYAIEEYVWPPRST